MPSPCSRTTTRPSRRCSSVREGGRRRLRREAGDRRPDHRGALDPRRRSRSSSSTRSTRATRPRDRGHRPREPRGAPHRQVGAVRARRHGPAATSASTPRSPSSWRTCATTSRRKRTEYFPKVRDELGRKALDDLGDAMETAKKTAPTHPHPRCARHAPRQPRRRAPPPASSTGPARWARTPSSAPLVGSSQARYLGDGSRRSVASGSRW